MTRIKEIRLAAGISQKQFAIDMGVSQPTVCDWESGKTRPTIENTIKISKYFDVPINYLMGITDDPGDPKPAAASTDDINDQLRFALFNGENIDLDDAALDEIRAYARFKYEQQKNGRK